MTQPPWHDQGGLASSVPAGDILQSSTDLPSCRSPDISAAKASSSINYQTDLSYSESRLPRTPTPSSLANSGSTSIYRSQSYERSSISSPGSTLSIPSNFLTEENRLIILRSFAPRVAVYASADTEEFVRAKGFSEGLCSLLRPFGERLLGKVIIRDSVGGSRGWDNFGIRFIPSDLLKQPLKPGTGGAAFTNSQTSVNGSRYSIEKHMPPYSNDLIAPIETVLDRYLKTEHGPSTPEKAYFDGDQQSQASSSPLYPRYLRKLLSAQSLVPHETFAHPVACMIVVSSRSAAPIEALRQLYANTGHASRKIPAWIGTEYLRYYVLIHDDENDDITKSTALFDLMKRHFGLHCHLLRLKSSQCVETDDDSVQIPSCEWSSADEELIQDHVADYTHDGEVPKKYILESDAAAINSLLREMVAQSIVPFMESRVMTWNDQVASRRRGISGRFMSLSKRWTGFGSNKITTSNTSGNANANASSSNYNSQQGFYPPEAPEATMRRLGDYAFMLRDWKLAYSTYEFLRSDFSHDKAWAYHAAANEMAAITILLNPQTINLKSRTETIDQLLDTAAYSYLTRCSLPFGVVRGLTLATELLTARGPATVDHAARWGGKLLELGVLTPITQALTAERIADCYTSQVSDTSFAKSARTRQAALWNILASDSWRTLQKPNQARLRLRNASALYGLAEAEDSMLPFSSMRVLWNDIERVLGESNSDNSSPLIDTGVKIEESPKSSPTKVKGQLETYTHDFIGFEELDAEGFTTTQEAARLVSRNE